MKERIKDGSSIVNKEYCTSWERFLAKLNSRYYDKLRNKNTIKGSILYSISPSILRNEQVCCDKTNTNNLCHMTKDWKYGEEPLNVIYFTTHSIYVLLYAMPCFYIYNVCIIFIVIFIQLSCSCSIFSCTSLLVHYFILIKKVVLQNEHNNLTVYVFNFI